MLKELQNTTAIVSSCCEFRSLFEGGLIDIVQLTSRQKFLFLICISVPGCMRNMMIVGTKNEEEFYKLRKAFPSVVCVLRDSGLYDPEQVKPADYIADGLWRVIRKY